MYDHHAFRSLHDGLQRTVDQMVRLGLSDVDSWASKLNSCVDARLVRRLEGAVRLVGPLHRPVQGHVGCRGAADPPADNLVDGYNFTMPHVSPGLLSKTAASPFLLLRATRGARGSRATTSASVS